MATATTSASIKHFIWAAEHMPQLFALTIFCGSFLLFLVQPIIAKELLPQFGGSASVWLTCLVFFQSALLLGYAGADRFVTLVPPRLRILLVVVVVLAAAAALPIVPAAAGGLGITNPALSVLATLARTVGPPYVLVATTLPWCKAGMPACCPAAAPMVCSRCPIWPQCWRCSVIRWPWNRGSALTGKPMAGPRPTWSGPP